MPFRLHLYLRLVTPVLFALCARVLPSDWTTRKVRIRLPFHLNETRNQTVASCS